MTTRGDDLTRPRCIPRHGGPISGGAGESLCPTVPSLSVEPSCPPSRHPHGAGPNNVTLKGDPSDSTAASPATVVRGETGSIEIIDRLADEWRAMCWESPRSHPFFQPEWIRAFLSAFEPEGRLLLITARASGRLTGVLPLLEERRRVSGFPVTVLKAAAGVHSGRFDLAVAPHPPVEETVAAIWEHLSQERQWGLIVLRDVPEDGALQQLVACARRSGFLTGQFVSLASPYFPLSGFNGNWESWLTRLKGDFRRELRRRGRRLAAAGPVRLRRVDQADPELLERFYELEASGWKGAEGTAIARDGATRHFYDQVAAAASRLGYFSLYFLEVNGRAIAGHFGLAHGNRYFVPKLAYHEDYAAFSPGHLLVNEVARDCAERGLAEFDFLGPWMEWKGCWTASIRRHWSLYIYRDNLLGRALYGMTFGWKSFAKKILGRAGREATSVMKPPSAVG